MARAYVLINTGADKDYEIVKALKKTDGVVAADVLFGKYDVIAVIEVADITGISRIIDNVRRTTAGVEKTSTMIVKSDYMHAMGH